MMTNERCFEIEEYIYKLLYHKPEQIEEELILESEEEQKFFDRIYKVRLEEKKARDAYQKKHKKEGV